MLPTTVELLRDIRVLESESQKTDQEVPEETRLEFPSLEWRKMAGMRDRLVHDYGGVDYLIVWEVAANKAPELVAKLRLIVGAAG